jgi:hypothetical protein
MAIWLVGADAGLIHPEMAQSGVGANTADRHLDDCGGSGNAPMLAVEGSR